MGTLDRLSNWFAWNILKRKSFDDRRTPRDVGELAEHAERMIDEAPISGPRAEKIRLHQVMGRCVQLIKRDRQRVLERFHKEARAAVDGFLPLPSEELAVLLWDGWAEEEREEITVESGYYIADKKVWFRVRGEPILVEEPVWSYIIDPFPVGVTLYDQIFEPAPRIRVVEPMSPDSRLYSAIEGVVRPEKKA